MPLSLIASKDCMFLRGCRFFLMQLAGLTLALGCAPSESSGDRTDTDKHFMAIGGAYRAYGAERSGLPKNPEQLREFLESKQEMWSQYAETIDAFLVSPRDGKPMILLTGEAIGPVSPVGRPWVAYESVGVDGVRRIVDARGFFEDKQGQEIEALFGANQENE